MVPFESSNGNALDGRAVVADGAVHGLHRVVDELARALRVSVASERGALDAHARHLAVLAEHLVRRLKKVQVNASRGARGLAQRPVVEGLDHLLGLVMTIDRGQRALVIVVVLGVHDDVDVGNLTQLAQLERRELHLGGTAPAEEVNVGHRETLEDLEDVRGNVGGEQVLGVLREHPRDVESDVSDAEDRDLFGLERPRARHVGVAVVPAHKVGGAIRAIQVNTRDVEVGIAERSGGEDDRVVVLAEVLEGEVRADVDVGEQADVAAAQERSRAPR